MFTPRQRIDRTKVDFMRDPRFAHLSGIFMLGDTEVTDEVPTACTDGRNVQFNPRFVNQLDDAELRGLVYHEYGGHIMMRHLMIYKNLYKEDARLANAACDYVVNQLIADYRDPRFIKLPEGGLQDDRFRGMDSKQVFNILKAEGYTPPPSMDDHDWEAADELSDDEQKQLAVDVEQAVRQGVVASKLLGNPVDRAIEEWLNPQIDWREALRDFIVVACSGSDQSTYRKPRRRMLGENIYLPTHYSDTVQSIVLAIDTSYSTDTLLPLFIAELVGVCESVKPDVVHVIYWGSQIARHETYDVTTLESIKQSTKPKSGGGTTVSCVTRYMDEQGIEPTCSIVLTDGELGSDWGNWRSPVLWAMTSRVVAPVGTTIRLTM